MQADVLTCLAPSRMPGLDAGLYVLLRGIPVLDTFLDECRQLHFEAHMAQV